MEIYPYNALKFVTEKNTYSTENIKKWRINLIYRVENMCMVFSMYKKNQENVIVQFSFDGTMEFLQIQVCTKRSFIFKLKLM